MKYLISFLLIFYVGTSKAQDNSDILSKGRTLQKVTPRIPPPKLAIFLKEKSKGELIEWEVSQEVYLKLSPGWIKSIIVCKDECPPHGKIEIYLKNKRATRSFYKKYKDHETKDIEESERFITK